MEQYTTLLEDVLSKGNDYHDRTGTGRRSVLGMQRRWNVTNSFPLMTIKNVYWKGIVHELLWFLGAIDDKYKAVGNTNIKYLVDHDVNIWNEWPYQRYVKEHKKKQKDGQLQFPPMTLDEFKEAVQDSLKFAMKHGELGPVYGAQWRDFNGTDQIKRALDLLKNKPNSSRNLTSAWNAADLDKMLLPPCHYAFYLYTTELTLAERVELYQDRAGGEFFTREVKSHDRLDDFDIPKFKLSLGWNQRSVDTFLGLPFNIASYALLLYLFAKVMNMVPHELVFQGWDVHIYHNHFEQVNKVLERAGSEPRLPTIELDNLDNIFDFRYKNIHLQDYNPLDSIKAPVAV